MFTGTIQEITGVDLVVRANAVLGGDWRQLYPEAVLFGDAGHAFRAIRANILNGRVGVEQYWRGNAAGGAEQWLDRYAATSGQYAEFMTEAGQRNPRLGPAPSYHLMENLRDGLGLVLDVALAIVTEGSSDEVEAAIEVFEATVGDPGTLVGLAKGDDVPQRLVGLIASLCEASGVSPTPRRHCWRWRTGWRRPGRSSRCWRRWAPSPGHRIRTTTREVDDDQPRTGQPCRTPDGARAREHLFRLYRAKTRDSVCELLVCGWFRLLVDIR